MKTAACIQRLLVAACLLSVVSSAQASWPFSESDESKAEKLASRANAQLQAGDELWRLGSSTTSTEVRAANMSKATDEEHAYLYVLRFAMASFIKGTAPIMAVEVARRAIPGHVRPTFQELETFCRNKGEAAAPQEAAAA